MAPDWRAIKSSCSDEGMDWEDVKFFGPAVVEELKQCWSKCSSGLLSICRSMRCDNTIVMAWNGACSRPDFFASIPNLLSKQMVQASVYRDAPSLSHQSIPLVNRWSRLVVYLLKACSQWVSENTEAKPPVPIINFSGIHKHPSQKTHQGLAQCTVAGILGVFAGLDLGGQSYQTYEVVGAIWSSECFWMLMF